MTLNPATIEAFEEAMALASKAAAAREVYRDVKGIFKRGASSFRAARRGVKKMAKGGRSLGKRIRDDISYGSRKVRGNISYIERNLGLRKRKPKRSTPPTNPGNKVAAQYAIAPTMRKFKKVNNKKLSKAKVPKAFAAHYKDYGMFSANRTIFVNHEHWSSGDRFWTAIGLGLAKTLLARAKLTNGKSIEDALIGPRTNPLNIGNMMSTDNASSSDALYMELVFATEGDEGAVTYTDSAISLVDATPSPDVYRSMEYVAKEIATALQTKYFATQKTWLCGAQILLRASGSGDTLQPQNVNASPIVVMNLDDAEISLVCKSLIKFQNVTPSDTAGAASNMDRGAIDANPLEGRIYSGKGQHPIIDTDLLASGDRSLDKYFGDTETNGFTLCGHANVHTASDVGRIAHLPDAKRLYGNQTVMAGTIHMAPGAMKFHKTYFTMKRTFRSLADVCAQQQSAAIDQKNLMVESFNKHTLFGFTVQHRHGEDTIKLGYNRETDVSATVKTFNIKYPLKANYTYNEGVKTTTVVPTEHEL